MKAEKKRVGIKAQIRAENERGRRVATAIFLAIILASAALSAYFGYTILNPSTPPNSIEPTLQFKPENPNPKLKAAIVDQLSLTFPNQAFMETAANILNQAGYSVDYYRGEKVTVELYARLPRLEYGLIVLRAHSGFIIGGGTSTFLFSSEPYSAQEHISEQLTDQLAMARLTPGGPLYFGLGKNFVESGMQGTFNKTTIIMMGCNGLTYTDMAQAFVNKGAKVFIGWNCGISASDTDEATTCLLRNMITENRTVGNALDDAIKIVGSMLAPNDTLEYYPPESGTYTIQR